MCANNITSYIFLPYALLQVELPDDDSENPLDNAEVLQEQLECVRHLCRFQVEIYRQLYVIYSLFCLNNIFFFNF